MKLKHNAMANDERPIDSTCSCMVRSKSQRSTVMSLFVLHEMQMTVLPTNMLQVCKNYSRAYIHSLITRDAMGSQLLSYHNLSYMMRVNSVFPSMNRAFKLCCFAFLSIFMYSIKFIFIFLYFSAKQGPPYIHCRRKISRVCRLLLIIFFHGKYFGLQILMNCIYFL